MITIKSCTQTISETKLKIRNPSSQSQALKRPSSWMTSFVGAAGLKPSALPPAGGMRYNQSLFRSSSTDIKKGHPLG